MSVTLSHPHYTLKLIFSLLYSARSPRIQLHEKNHPDLSERRVAGSLLCVIFLPFHSDTHFSAWLPYGAGIRRFRGAEITYITDSTDSVIYSRCNHFDYIQ